MTINTTLSEEPEVSLKETKGEAEKNLKKHGALDRGAPNVSKVPANPFFVSSEQETRLEKEIQHLSVQHRLRVQKLEASQRRIDRELQQRESVIQDLRMQLSFLKKQLSKREHVISTEDDKTWSAVDSTTEFQNIYHRLGTSLALLEKDVHETVQIFVNLAALHDSQEKHCKDLYNANEQLKTQNSTLDLKLQQLERFNEDNSKTMKHLSNALECERTESGSLSKENKILQSVSPIMEAYVLALNQTRELACIKGADLEIALKNVESGTELVQEQMNHAQNWVTRRNITRHPIFVPLSACKVSQERSALKWISSLFSSREHSNVKSYNDSCSQCLDVFLRYTRLGVQIQSMEAQNVQFNEIIHEFLNATVNIDLREYQRQDDDNQKLCKEAQNERSEAQQALKSLQSTQISLQKKTDSLEGEAAILRRNNLELKAALHRIATERKLYHET